MGSWGHHALFTFPSGDRLGKQLSACQTASHWLREPPPGRPSTLTPAHPMLDPDLQAQGSLLNLSLPTALDSMSPQPQSPWTQPHSQTDSYERPWKLSKTPLSRPMLPKCHRLNTESPLTRYSPWSSGFQREDPRVWLREIVSPFSRWVVLRCGKIAGKVVGGPRAKYNVGIPGSAFRLSINPGLSLHPTPPTSRLQPETVAYHMPTTSGFWKGTWQ